MVSNASHLDEWMYAIMLDGHSFLRYKKRYVDEPDVVRARMQTGLDTTPGPAFVRRMMSAILVHFSTF